MQEFQLLKVCLGCFLQVKATQVAGAPANATCEAVVLDTPLLPGKATTLETYSVLMNQLVPKPKEITQADVQRVLLTASRYPLSPYKIASASTQVCSSRRVFCGPCQEKRASSVLCKFFAGP